MSARFPASPPPLSNQDTYTTWPGGVDPTARVYDSVGGAKTRKASRKASRKAHRKAHKKAHKKASRKASRKVHRKAQRKTRRSRRH
jgi:hypothetical protein